MENDSLIKITYQDLLQRYPQIDQKYQSFDDYYQLHEQYQGYCLVKKEYHMTIVDVVQMTYQRELAFSILKDIKKKYEQQLYLLEIIVHDFNHVYQTYLYGNHLFLEIKEYKDIPPEAIKIRQTVFMKEQGFTDEFDERDHHCSHIVLYDGLQAIATCRYFEEEGHYVLGRIAVVQSYRYQRIGTMMILYVLKKLQFQTVVLLAQLQAVPFYEKLGFHTYGQIEYEEHCPHTWMKKE